MPKYSLGVPLPVLVSLGGVQYRVHIHRAEGSGNWRLSGEFPPGGSCVIAQNRDEFVLRTEVLLSGFEVPEGTTADAICAQLAKEGRARAIKVA